MLDTRPAACRPVRDATTQVGTATSHSSNDHPSAPGWRTRLGRSTPPHNTVEPAAKRECSCSALWTLCWNVSLVVLRPPEPETSGATLRLVATCLGCCWRLTLHHRSKEYTRTMCVCMYVCLFISIHIIQRTMMMMFHSIKSLI